MPASTGEALIHSFWSDENDRKLLVFRRHYLFLITLTYSTVNVH